ncbi:metallophosphoesterase [Roseimaritima ulvae]|uniref:Phosphodiesterase YaeI n=1 Tax=Roseimaritima ulvae TaxID=980254 RepID=A0A5B9QTW3_9BACT|nr:metallophosphoesterase [Roseimaritima ulvae]QEG42454.1 phosphodiesterase YaeI [Roseimaritima ulvae]
MDVFSGNLPHGFWWTYFAAAIIGHFGLYLAIYNRLNSLGIPRHRIKQLEWVFLVLCLLTPLGLTAFYGDFLRAALWETPPWQAMPAGLVAYTALCLAVWLYPGIPWLWTRPIFGFQHVEVEKGVRRVDVRGETNEPLALTAKCRFQSRWPFNQILQLAIEEKQLPVLGLPPQLDGLKIAHLSDIHLTGHIAPQYFRYAVDQANAWQPDLVALTGDIVDSDDCIDWVTTCFQHATATAGCYFVLGNHDTRVRDPGQIRAAMTRIGWRDAGGRQIQQTLRGCPLTLLGNEAPWFPAPPDDAADSGAGPEGFTMALCHSPDRIDWARRRGVQLVLAGHTHGGQGRLPILGPILSPSRYGSRFASGEFYLQPTTMHVSRGLSGVHLLRLRCPPELALLVLRTA